MERSIFVLQSCFHLDLRDGRKLFFFKHPLQLSVRSLWSTDSFRHVGQYSAHLTSELWLLVHTKFWKALSNNSYLVRGNIREVKVCREYVPHGILMYFLECIMFFRRLHQRVVCLIQLNLHSLSWFSVNTDIYILQECKYLYHSSV